MSKVQWIMVTAVVLLIALVYVSHRMATTHKRVQAVALINALQQIYDVAVGTNRTDAVGPDFDPPSIRKRILDRLGHGPQLLPTFVNTNDVYVTHQAVLLQSTNLLLAIKAGDRLIYAITADRQARELSIDQFRSWKHEGL
jgi:hypothetical protein